MLRNALVAAELNELDDPQYELIALRPLMYALLKTHSIDEVEPLGSLGLLDQPTLLLICHR